MESLSVVSTDLDNERGALGPVILVQQSLEEGREALGKEGASIWRLILYWD